MHFLSSAMFFSTFIFLDIFCIVFALSSWNGQQGSSNSSNFFPFHASDGNSITTCSSLDVHYAPSGWSVLRNNSLFSTGEICISPRTGHATATLSFTGSGVEWYGPLGPRYGVQAVYIDGKLVSYVDMSGGVLNNKTYTQQLLFGTSHLQSGVHQLEIKSNNSIIAIEAFVIIQQNSTSTEVHSVKKIKREDDASMWKLSQRGMTGVAAMQISVISQDEVLIIDKVEHNVLSIDGHPAWGAVYNITDDTVRPLKMHSNSFCAGGSFLANGTLISIGGNPVVTDKTDAADFGDANGLQSIRMYNAELGEMQEWPSRIHLYSARWYNTVCRLHDGSVAIIGGSTRGGWINNETVNNPTVEFYPPKTIAGFSHGQAIPLQFLKDTLRSNLFPIVILLPDGNLFIAANTRAIIYNWENNKVTPLPDIPNGVRVTYPMTGTAILLPLSSKNNYVPQILICGGSTIDDKKRGSEINSTDPASDQCSRIALSNQGIADGWEIETMPTGPRIMPDALHMPDGKILIINGAASGIAGYGNVKDQVGNSNAANPVLQPILYDSEAAHGFRFTVMNIPVTDIPRMYHSVATLTPKGNVMIAGSNPNLDRSTQEFSTEYRVEWLDPPYISLRRPLINGLPSVLNYGSEFQLSVDVVSANTSILVTLVDFGFVTHSLHMSSRLVILEADYVSGSLYTVKSPLYSGIFPPGPGWLFVTIDNLTSEAQPTLVGTGGSPTS